MDASGGGDPKSKSDRRGVTHTIFSQKYGSFLLQQRKTAPFIISFLRPKMKL
jgi:hypothetical protein